MGTITVTYTTANPSVNLTKTYTDTDANLTLALNAVQYQYNAVSQSAGALAWFNSVISGLVQITNTYQRNTNAITQINPT